MAPEVEVVEEVMEDFSAEAKWKIMGISSVHKFFG